MVNRCQRSVVGCVLTGVLGVALSIAWNPGVAFAKESKNTVHEVRLQYNRLLHEKKIAEHDAQAIRDKIKESQEYNKTARKDGLSPEEKEKMKANRQEVDHMMENAVAKAHS